MLENPRLRWMFSNCYPNTLDTTVHPMETADGQPDTYVYTGDIPAMWLRDSGAQVWPYVRYVSQDEDLRRMIAGVINRQFKCICIDPYANAFNVEPMGQANSSDWPKADPYVFERKWELDSHCYPIRLAYEYWKQSGDTSVFGEVWLEAMDKMLTVMREQQRKDGPGRYRFLRVTDRQLDTKCVVGKGNPVKPTGLIASAFRPSDDATTFEFLVPSEFMAVSSLRKAAEILSQVNGDADMARECLDLAAEVEQEGFSCSVVEPDDGVEVVAASAVFPVVSEEFFVGVGELPFVVGGEDGYDAFVAAPFVVVLEDLECEHVCPELSSAVVFVDGTEESVGLCAAQDAFYPELCFVEHCFVVQDV